MVRLIERIEFTVVDTEHDALLLENVLIKKHQPRYNIRLKDDKTYPFLVLRNEPFQGLRSQGKFDAMARGTTVPILRRRPCTRCWI